MKNALITGAAKRVGLEIAKALKADGWNVLIHYNTTPVTGFKSIKADLNNFNEVKDLIKKANAEIGEISLLINNASIFDRVDFHNTDEKLFDSNFNIHVKAPFFLAQQFAKQCTNGQIINIIDHLTDKSKQHYFAYALSKQTLANLTEMLAKDLAPNIRVNSIHPKPIKEFSENIEAKTSIDDVTKAINELTKNNVTGQAIIV